MKATVNHEGAVYGPATFINEGVPARVKFRSGSIDIYNQFDNGAGSPQYACGVTDKSKIRCWGKLPAFVCCMSKTALDEAKKDEALWSNFKQNWLVAECDVKRTAGIPECSKMRKNLFDRWDGKVGANGLVEGYFPQKPLA